MNVYVLTHRKEAQMLNCLNSIKYGLFWCSIWNFLTQILPLYSMSLSLPQTCITFLDVKAQCIAY